MRRGLIVLCLLLFVCSFVSAQNDLIDSDSGYSKQQYYPGYVLADGVYYYDTCQEYDDGQSDYYALSGTEDLGEVTDAIAEDTLEWVYTIGGEFQRGVEKKYYLKEYCIDDDVCEQYGDVEQTSSGVYYVQIYCQYGCADSDFGDYCITRQDRDEVMENVDDDDPIIGCGESDERLQKYVPAFSKHVGFRTYEYFDNCAGTKINEGCCGNGCGDNSLTSRLHVSQKDCDYGCVYVPDAPDFCAKESWIGCTQDSQCASFYDCIGGECVEAVVQGYRNVDESQLDSSCAFYGCDCDGDGDLADEVHYYRLGDSVSALASNLCNADPGTTILGNDAWCDQRRGIWYPVASDQEEGCYIGSIGSRTRTLSRAPSREAFLGLFARIKAVFN